MKKRSMGANVLPILFLAFCFIVPVAAQKAKISTEEEIKEDVSLNVCKNNERLEAVKMLFRKMGAADSDIKVEKLKDVSNVIVTRQGKSEETVVLGAHYDKVSDGCGAIDNWTGIVVLANLYRTLKDLDTQKTYVFAAFGKEELGLLGSDEMARSIPKEQRAKYCAMVNFDSFGLGFPQVMTNISDGKLIDLAKEAAAEMKLPFAQAVIENASSDSQSFRNRKIPAIGIHGLSDKWRDYLHTTKDRVENVNIRSVYLGYRFSLGLAVKIDARGCGDFR